MIHILLTVLKTIGIVLLVVLGILLLLMLLLLFVPIRYRVEAAIYEDKKVWAKIDWLLHAFGVLVTYENGQLNVKLKLFWFIPIQLIPAKEKKAKPTKVKKVKEKNKVPIKAVDAVDTAVKAEGPTAETELAEVAKEVMGFEVSDTEAEVSTGDINVVQKVQSNEEEAKDVQEDGESVHRPGLFARLWNVIKKTIGLPVTIYRKITGIFRKLHYTIQSTCDKIKHVKGQVNVYLELLQRDETKMAFSKCKDQLLKIIKHVLPTKISGEFHVGMDDPATTGQIYGAYCAACAVHKNRIRIQPDFENKVMEGWIKVKGRIRGCNLLIAGLKILFDKNVRNFIKLFKQI